MTNRYIYLTLLAVIGFKADMLAAETPAGGVPRLVVSIVIDQLRNDYLEAFAPLYSEKGFKRLLGQGTVYGSASYPFTPIDRASAIAALTSGTTPYYNNIVGQQWLSRETLRPVVCVDDARHGGLGTSETASPAELCVSTLADELKMATGGGAIVYAIAAHRDAAVLSGGHAADGVLWIDDVAGEWCSSQYYFKNMPQWVKAFNKSYAPSLKAEGSDEQRFRRYKQGWRSNADVTNVAQQCLVSMQMGIDQTPDLLCLTYQAVCQTMTNSQSDIQEAYIRLDHELGRLVSQTEKWLGKENVLFVVTSTGYCEEAEPDYETYRIPSGTFYMERTAGLLNMYFGAIWGQEKYVEATYGNQIFLNHKLLDAKKISLADATSKARELLAMMSGVKNVYTSMQLLTTQNEHLQKRRNGFSIDRCGDMIVEVAPGWRILQDETSETETTKVFYCHFPIIFYGAGISAQRIQLPVTTDRIAPTIARAIRIRAPNACASEPLF